MCMCNSDGHEMCMRDEMIRVNVVRSGYWGVRYAQSLPVDGLFYVRHA